MAAKKTSSSVHRYTESSLPPSATAPESSSSSGDGSIPPGLAKALAVVEEAEREPLVIEGGGNGLEPPPPPADGGAAEEPQRSRSPFEAIESEVGLGKRESIFRNLEALRILPDEDDSDLTEEVLTTIPIRRPGKRAFRAHLDDKYQFEAFILENLKEKVACYITPSLGKVLIDQAIENLKHVILTLCINKSGKMFFWPIPAKGNFRGSGLMAVGLARDAWIKAVGDLEQGGYQIVKMLQSEYGEPAWPAVMPSIEDLLELAFHDNIIITSEHPELKAAKNV
jgi:hypothetical protein